MNCNGGTATQKYLILDAYHPWESVLSFEWKNHGLNKENALPTYHLPRLFSNGCLHYQTPSYGSIYNTQGDCSCASYTGCANATFSRYPAIAVPDAQRVNDQYLDAIAQTAIPRQSVADQSTVGFDWQLPRERVGMVYAGPFTYGRGDGNFEVWGYSKHRTPTLEVGDLVIDGYVHEHRVTATRNGEVVWSFIAGGRLASRGGPVSDGTRVYFGSHDGYVYAVNVNDGSLAWRTLVAVEDLRIVGFGQIESAWPVFCVLLHEGAIYTSSGRHQEVDGGVRFFKINADDGSVAWHTKFVSGMLTNKEHDNCTGVKSVSLQNGDLAIQDNKLIIHPHHVDHIPLDRQVPENMKAPGHQYRKFQTPIYSIDLSNPRDSIEFPGGLIPPNPVAESGPDYNPSVRAGGYMKRVMGQFVRMAHSANGVRITAPPRTAWEIELYTVSGRTLHKARGVGSAFERIDFSRLAKGYHILRLNADDLKEIRRGVLIVQ